MAWKRDEHGNFSPSQREKMIALFEEGKTGAEIARTAGCTDPPVYHTFRKYFPERYAKAKAKYAKDRPQLRKNKGRKKGKNACPNCKGGFAKDGSCCVTCEGTGHRLKKEVTQAQAVRRYIKGHPGADRESFTKDTGIKVVSSYFSRIKKLTLEEMHRQYGQPSAFGQPDALGQMTGPLSTKLRYQDWVIKGLLNKVEGVSFIDKLISDIKNDAFGKE